MAGGWEVVVGHSLQTLVGLVLLVAGGTKLLRRPAAFVGTLRGYRVVPEQLVVPVAATVLVAEVLVGLALVSGTGVAVALPAAFVLFAAFGAAVTINLGRGRAVPCGCFGSMDERISGRTVVRLSLLLLATSSVAALRWIVDATPPTATDLLSDGLDGADRLAGTWGIAAFLMVVGVWTMRIREVAELVGGIRPSRERS